MRDHPERELELQGEQAQRAQQRDPKGPDNIQRAKFRLYDKIKARVSVRTMDAIIIASVVLIVVAIIVGMIIGP